MCYILRRHQCIMFKYIAIFICLYSVHGVTGQGLSFQPGIWVQGKSASLTCTGTSRIAVIKDELEVASCRVDLSSPCTINPLFNTYTVSKTRTSLTIKIPSLSKARDSGRWTCEGVGVTFTINVDVLPIVHIKPSTSPYKVIQGNQSMLTCTVDNSDASVDSTDYTWSKDGKMITGQNSSIYRIESVERSDSGSYTCTGRNGAGTGRSTTPVQLDVLYGPNVTLSADSTTKIERDDLQLTCTVESNPPPTTFKWYKPDGSSVDVSSNGRLDISNITRNQGGVYRCEATTILVPTNGSSITISDSSTVNITVLSNPDAPSKIINSSVPSHDSICITWTPGFNGGDQQEFIVQHSVDNNTWTSSTPLPESDYCIKNLQADTPYYIRVIARNKYGDSQPVYSSTIQTFHRDVPPTPPGTNNGGLIAGVVIAVLVVIIVVIVAVILVRKMRKKNEGKASTNAD